MKTGMRAIIVALALLAGFYFATALLANIGGLAAVADRVRAGSGDYVFWILCVALAVLLAAPVVLFFAQPPALVAPHSAEGPEYEAFRRAFAARLKANPLLAGAPIESEAQMADACARLNIAAEAAIKETASTVFVSTAIMQNGRLDGLIVFLTQIRLVWRIARIYTQRPSPRQMAYLYGNVGVNALVAENLQEIEFMEIAAPIVTSIIPSLKGAMPGFQGISTLLVNSLANGCSNAFLTLRIGLMTKMYCESLIRPEASLLKRNATVRALALVGGIARTQGERVVKNAWNAVSHALGAAVDASFETVKSTVGQVAEAASGSARSAGGAVGRTWRSLKATMSPRRSGGESGGNG